MSRPRGDAPLGYRFTARVVWLAYRALGWRLDVAGVEHVPDTGGAVLTWNHTSHVDFAVTAVPLLHRTGRWVRLLALRQLWRSRTLGWIPRLAQCVPVDRETAAGRLGALRDAVAALRAGDLVMVAPEGTISESFEPLPMRAGVVRMAQAADVPIVPTVSWGSHRFVTTGRPASLRRGWRLPVVVRVGAPIRVAPDDDPTVVLEQLERVVARMLAEARAAYQDGAPPGAWWVPAAMGGGAPAHDEVLARHRPGQALNPGRFADPEDTATGPPRDPGARRGRRSA